MSTQYTEEFKIEAVKHFEKSGKSATQIANELALISVIAFECSILVVYLIVCSITTVVLRKK